MYFVALSLYTVTTWNFLKRKPIEEVDKRPIILLSNFLFWTGFFPSPENIPSAYIYEISDLKYSDKFKRRRVNFVPDFILKLTEESERNSQLCE